ncbi:chromosome complete related protein, putative [Babesia ovis]|uniref:Chromosome complete related protein, putative n=1 Tax=Babesia ovis TaxID=5869 RepID=A0A9W5WUF1_BABOV|nr:chromosome complete related protein, putative [Babesia ovis]
MDVYSGNLSTDLLDATSRYLNGCNLKSYVLPLPFCDEAVLDRKGLLAKILSNNSCLGKEQLFDIIEALSRRSGASNVDVEGNSEGRTSGSRHHKLNKEKFKEAFDSSLGTYGDRSRPTRTTRKTVAPQTGIRSTLRPSTAVTTEKLLDELASIHGPEQISQQIDTTIQRLSKPQTVGFVMIIAAEKESPTGKKLLPVAGSVVEILDAEEHCIRAIWCDPRLVKQEEVEFGKIVILRTLGHLFDYGYPGGPANNKLKHTSVLNVHGILFPSAIYVFMINVLKFGKHFETENNGGSHEDSSSSLCRCHRLAESPGAELFWGISESRLKSTFYHIRTQMPIKPSELTLGLLRQVV